MSVCTPSHFTTTAAVTLYGTVDLVIWGNEHECIPHLQESLVGTYRILQPGSSVATSLHATESNQCPKHFMFFEVKQKKFRMKAIRYRAVRQFVYADINLRDYAELDAKYAQVEDQIKGILTSKVDEMIAEGRRALRSDAVVENESAGNDALSRCKYAIKDPQKVLVRLKVSHEGFPSLNQQRFGTQYVGKVANPADMLLLTKKGARQIMTAADGGAVGSAQEGGAKGDSVRRIIDGADGDIDAVRIEELVNATLANRKTSLSLLVEAEMAQVGRWCASPLSPLPHASSSNAASSSPTYCRH